MYCVMTFNVFVCSTCAGIHREMNHKVKGISMCVFNEAELKGLTDGGNLVSPIESLFVHHQIVKLKLDCPIIVSCGVARQRHRCSSTFCATEYASQAHEELESKEQPHPREV